jgi:two-component system nitrogen regulation response regulator GlnG
LRRVIGRALSKAGFDVVEADSGLAALERAASGDFDAVISDVRMPRMNGLELLERLQQGHPDLPIVLMSGSSEVANKSAALELGAFDYLQKPLVLSDLRHSAERAIATRQRTSLTTQAAVA